MTIQSFDDEAEAAELANSTSYGLSAIVYTSSEARAERMGTSLRAGTIWVNCFLVRDLTAPFGGTGISGIGREGGDYALDFYSDLKTLQIKGRDHPWVKSSARDSSRTYRPSCCPDELRRELNNGNESTLYTGLKQLRTEVFDVLKPDLVLVFDSHWFTTVEFVVTAAERRMGFFTSEELPRGMSSVPYDMPGNPDFARLVGKIADDTDDCWITPIDNEHLPVTYATLNFLGVLAGRRGVGLDRRLSDRGEPRLRDRRSRRRRGRRPE